MFATPAFFSTDDYYHARISEEIILQRRLRLDFQWLPLTILNPERYVDHHLLYHMALAPAVYFMDDITGAKVVTVAIAAGIFVAEVIELGLDRAPDVGRQPGGDDLEQERIPPVLIAQLGRRLMKRHRLLLLVRLALGRLVVKEPSSRYAAFLVGFLALSSESTARAIPPRCAAVAIASATHSAASSSWKM